MGRERGESVHADGMRRKCGRYYRIGIRKEISLLKLDGKRQMKGGPSPFCFWPIQKSVVEYIKTPEKLRSVCASTLRSTLIPRRRWRSARRMPGIF
jgi:hypothetical protein